MSMCRFDAIFWIGYSLKEFKYFQFHGAYKIGNPRTKNIYPARSEMTKEFGDQFNVVIKVQGSNYKAYKP